MKEENKVIIPLKEYEELKTFKTETEINNSACYYSYFGETIFLNPSEETVALVKHNRDIEAEIRELRKALRELKQKPLKQLLKFMFFKKQYR